MYLSELIQVHIALFKVATLLERLGLLSLEDYYRMNVLPHHIHKTLCEHEAAVKLLAQKVLIALRPNDYLTAKVCNALKHSSKPFVKSTIELISGKF